MPFYDFLTIESFCALCRSNIMYKSANLTFREVSHRVILILAAFISFLHFFFFFLFLTKEKSDCTLQMDRSRRAATLLN